MGLDGENTLKILGPRNVIDTIENSNLLFSTGDLEIQKVADLFFGDELLKMDRIGPACLVVRYRFRNQPVYQYLRELMKLYPQCWMKNKFFTDQGISGLWVARTKNGELWEQSFHWEQPSIEEFCASEDHDYSFAT